MIFLMPAFALPIISTRNWTSGSRRRCCWMTMFENVGREPRMRVTPAEGLGFPYTKVTVTQRLVSSRRTTLESPRLYSSNLTEISATLCLKGARRMINVVLVCPNMDVGIPIKRGAVLEFVRLVFDTGIVLENEL